MHDVNGCRRVSPCGVPFPSECACYQDLDPAPNALDWPRVPSGSLQGVTGCETDTYFKWSGHGRRRPAAWVWVLHQLDIRALP